MKKEDMRIWVTLRVLAQFHREHGRAPTRAELSIWEKIRDESLLTREWQQLGIEALYPLGYRNAMQFYRAVIVLRRAGLIDQKTYAPTDKGIKIAETLGDDWKDWRTFEEVCGIRADEYNEKADLTALQRQILQWSSDQAVGWRYEDMRRVHSYATQATINALRERGYLRSDEQSYQITDAGRAYLNRIARKENKNKKRRNNGNGINSSKRVE